MSEQLGLTGCNFARSCWPTGQSLCQHLSAASNYRLLTCNCRLLGYESRLLADTLTHTLLKQQQTTSQRGKWERQTIESSRQCHYKYGSSVQVSVQFVRHAQFGTERNLRWVKIQHWRSKIFYCLYFVLKIDNTLTKGQIRCFRFFSDFNWF